MIGGRKKLEPQSNMILLYDPPSVPHEIVGVVIKLERFSYLSSRSFGLGSPIGLGYLLTKMKENF